MRLGCRQRKGSIEAGPKPHLTQDLEGAFDNFSKIQYDASDTSYFFVIDENMEFIGGLVLIH
jgi:hypothetical protein